MAISKKIKLDNGVSLSYHTIKSIEVTNNEIIVLVDSFMSKKYHDLAIKKSNLLREQEILNEKFNEIYLDEKAEKELNILANKINKLADEINKCEPYEDYVLIEEPIVIPFIEDFSINNIEKYLISLEQFKDAELVD